MGKRSRIHQRAAIGVKEGQRLRAALGAAQRRIRELGGEGEIARMETAELRWIVANQTKQLEALTARVEFVMSREEELRSMLLSAHDQLMRRTEKIRGDLAAELYRSAPQESTVASHSTSEIPAAIRPVEQTLAPAGGHAGYEQLSKDLAYRRLVSRIQEVAKAVLPPEATVVVVSKGDEELLGLGGGRQGWHFPQNDDGVYAGHYPPDSVGAISHLEELQKKGAEFLLFPGTAFWWLERYREFGEHLDFRYRRVWNDETLIIFQLFEAQSTGEGRTP